MWKSNYWKVHLVLFYSIYLFIYFTCTLWHLERDSRWTIACEEKAPQTEQLICKLGSFTAVLLLHLLLSNFLHRSWRSGHCFLTLMSSAAKYSTNDFYFLVFFFWRDVFHAVCADVGRVVKLKGVNWTSRHLVNKVNRFFSQSENSLVALLRLPSPSRPGLVHVRATAVLLHLCASPPSCTSVSSWWFFEEQHISLHHVRWIINAARVRVRVCVCVSEIQLIVSRGLGCTVWCAHLVHAVRCIRSSDVHKPHVANV